MAKTELRWNGKHHEVRKLNRLGEAHIQKIAEAYKKFGAGDGFVRAVSLDEIKNNDYNLNVTLYVFPEEAQEEIDVGREWGELRSIEKEIAKVEENIPGYGAIGKDIRHELSVKGIILILR